MKTVVLAAVALCSFIAAAVAQPPPATPEGRKQIAKQVETIWLRNNIDMHVTTEGKEARTMRMRWVLAGRVFMQKLSDDQQLLRNLKSSGFTKLILTDGRDFTATWDLTKTQ